MCGGLKVELPEAFYVCFVLKVIFLLLLFRDTYVRRGERFKAFVLSTCSCVVHCFSVFNRVIDNLVFP